MTSLSTLNQLVRFPIAIALASLVSVMASTAVAQKPTYAPYSPKNHELIRGDMPPGVAADLTRMSNPKLEGHVQPVRVVGPIGSRIEVSSKEGYVTTNSSRVSVGLQVGPVYRFKVTNIPRHVGKELYPSIEVLGKLNPPKGLENEFPIQVVLGQEDFEDALQGRLVTKVIYLEDQEMSLPHRHQKDKQPYFNIGAAQDPLKTARKLGRPMAILRVGSRIPTMADQGQEFEFYAPSPGILPDPQGMSVQGEVVPAVPLQFGIPAYSNSDVRVQPAATQPFEIETPNSSLPPIVPGNAAPILNGGR